MKLSNSQTKMDEQKRSLLFIHQKK